MKFSKTFFGVALFILLLDQASKAVVKSYYDFSTNTGAAFGILQDQQPFLIGITLLIMAFIVYYSNEHPLALGLLMGGALGNLFDRFFLGHVIDFIALGFWPSFNIADAANTLGVLLLIYYWGKEPMPTDANLRTP